MFRFLSDCIAYICGEETDCQRLKRLFRRRKRYITELQALEKKIQTIAMKEHISKS